MKRKSYPVSLQSSQHLLSQLDLSTDLIDTIAAAQERLKEKDKQDEGQEVKGKQEEPRPGEDE